MASVFISYRHENDAHCEGVRQLATRLENAGIEVVLDVFAEEREFHGGAPPRGWGMWSIHQASVQPTVLIVASSGWFQVINNPQPTTSGKGAAAEAETVIARLYQNSGYNDFAGMLVFDRSDLDQIPPYLQRCARFDPASQQRFDALVQWIKRPLTTASNGSAGTGSSMSPSQSPSGQNSPLGLPEQAQPIVQFPSGWPSVDRTGFLDCRDAFDAYELLLNPDNRLRVLLMEGEGEHGKSELSRRFFAHATSALSPEPVAVLSLSRPVKPPLRLLDSIFESFRVPVTKSGNLDGRSRKLWESRNGKPTVLFIDGYEHAENEHRLWIDDILSRTLLAPLLRVVICGREVPLLRSQPWTIYSRHVHCDALRDPDAFIQHSIECGSSMSAEEIRTCCSFLRSQRDDRKRSGKPTEGLSPFALICEIQRRRQGGAAT